MLWFLFARLNRRSRRDTVRGSVVWAGVWAATVYMLYICFMSCMSPQPHLTPPPSGGPNQEWLRNANTISATVGVAPTGVRSSSHIP